jgi:RecB family exonuclease
VEALERSGRTLPLHDTVSVYLAEWESGIADLRAREPDMSKWLTGSKTISGIKDAERRRQRGADQTSAYWHWTRAQPLDIWESPDGPAVELKFSIVLGGVEVVGFIDQVLEDPMGSLFVRDIKTGTKLPDSAFQLGVYAEAIHQLYGIRPRFGDFYMAKNTAPTKPFDLSGYTAARLGRWFARLDRAVNAGAYIPNPGDACRTCSVSRWCDAVGEDRDTYGGD